MTLFPLTKDVQALLLRATASLERIDAAVADVQVLVRNANTVLVRVQQMLAAGAKE